MWWLLFIESKDFGKGEKKIKREGGRRRKERNLESSNHTICILRITLPEISKTERIKEQTLPLTLKSILFRSKTSGIQLLPVCERSMSIDRWKKSEELIQPLSSYQLPPLSSKAPDVTESRKPIRSTRAMYRKKYY